MGQIWSQLEAFASEHALLHVVDPEPGVRQVSVYSSNMKYRYAFARTLSESTGVVLWVLLNPGTGDTELRPRPTLARMIARSSSWGFGTLLVGNLFAARTKSAKHLRGKSEITGPLNDVALRFLAGNSGRSVAAWGNSGGLNGRSSEVEGMLSGAVCLGYTQRGEPKHPLYVPTSATFTQYISKDRYGGTA